MAAAVAAETFSANVTKTVQKSILCIISAVKAYSASTIITIFHISILIVSNSLNIKP